MKSHRITEVICETPDVVTLRFVDETDGHADFVAGQFVTVLFPDLDVPSGKAYSLSSTPNDPFLAITVKKLGIYSSRLHELKVGDEMLVSPPYGFLNPQFDGPIVMIAGGVGVSPLWSIVRDALAKDSQRDIQLWYSNRTLDDIVFAKELTDLAGRFEQFGVRHFITRQAKIPAGYEKGRIDVAKMLSQSKSTPSTFFFICGHENFVGDIWRNLVAAGVPENQLATETFY